MSSQKIPYYHKTAQDNQLKMYSELEEFCVNPNGNLDVNEYFHYFDNLYKSSPLKLTSPNYHNLELFNKYKSNFVTYYTSLSPQTGVLSHLFLFQFEKNIHAVFYAMLNVENEVAFGHNFFSYGNNKFYLDFLKENKDLENNNIFENQPISSMGFSNPMAPQMV